LRLTYNLQIFLYYYALKNTIKYLIKNKELICWI
jgi:hypothetical protein